MLTSDITFLPWDDAFSVGHRALDKEHRLLVGIINKIHAAEQIDNSHEEICVLANKFEFTTIGHFRHENSVLHLELSRKMPASLINEHMAEHAVALSDLKSIIQNHCTGIIMARSLSVDLKNWFVAHIAGHDAHIRDIVQAK
jgi:hemerythrin-like metal-binding protein